MNLVSWNMHRATKTSAERWGYLQELQPDIAMLQEVVSIPASVASTYKVVLRKAQGKRGHPQHFSTVLLVRGLVEQEISLRSSSLPDWVNEELVRFEGNLVAAKVMLESGESLRILSAYSPAWPVDRVRLSKFDVSGIKLKLNADVWVTELLWAGLSKAMEGEKPWIVGGDLNASITFDTMWGPKPRGNQELLDRMAALGFVECLSRYQGGLTPTYKNTTGGKVIHQMDHLFVSHGLERQLRSCVVGDPERVFGRSLSDHLPIIARFA